MLWLLNKIVEVDVRMRELSMVVALVIGSAGCVGGLGHGKIYGAIYPVGERADEPVADSMKVYGFTYPRFDSVSAAGPERHGTIVYGFQYPRPE